MRRFFKNLLALLRGLRFVQGVAVGGTHVIHADGGDGLQARIDLGCTDGEAPTAADTDDADALAIHEVVGTKEVHRRTEVFRIDVR
ncbi:hypothetical protein D3C81_2048960 [compost metagenome]